MRVPLRMRLAPAERERLWKGLERFVNCEDDLRNFQDLGRAFPSFWPVRIYYYLPESETQCRGAARSRIPYVASCVPWAFSVLPRYSSSRLEWRRRMA